MSVEENARAFYESARSEMIVRIGHRDQIKGVSIAIVFHKMKCDAAPFQFLYKL